MEEFPQKKIKILLIDNDQMMQIYFRDIFWIHDRSNRYDISIATNLKDAEKTVEDINTRPDFIFLDVILSEDNKKSSHISAYQIARCLEFVDKIKKNKEYSQIKVILYSGYRNNDLQNALVKLGIDGYLLKGELLPKEVVSFTDNLHGSHN